MTTNHLSRKIASSALAALLAASLAPIALGSSPSAAYADDPDYPYEDSDEETGIWWDDPAFDEPDEGPGEPPILQSERAAFEAAKAAGLPWKSKSDPHTWVYENGEWVPYDTYPVPGSPSTGTETPDTPAAPSVTKPSTSTSTSTGSSTADDYDYPYEDSDEETGIWWDDPAFDEPDEGPGEPPILQSERAAFEAAKAAGLPWKSKSDPHTWVYENGEWVPYDTYPVPGSPSTGTETPDTPAAPSVTKPSTSTSTSTSASKTKADAKAKSTAQKAVKKVKVTAKKVKGSKKALTVTWKKIASAKQKNVTGFQVQYSTSAKFKNAKTKAVSGKAKTSIKVTGLKAKKTYYVRIRPYKTVKLSTGKSVEVYGSWSKKLAVKTK